MAEVLVDLMTDLQSECYVAGFSETQNSNIFTYSVTSVGAKSFMSLMFQEQVCLMISIVPSYMPSIFCIFKMNKWGVEAGPWPDWPNEPEVPGNCRFEWPGATTRPDVEALHHERAGSFEHPARSPRQVVGRSCEENLFPRSDVVLILLFFSNLSFLLFLFCVWVLWCCCGRFI